MTSDLAVEIRAALDRARVALSVARRTERRTDCLAEAVRALEGALRNVEAEDANATHPEPRRYRDAVADLPPSRL